MQALYPYPLSHSQMCKQQIRNLISTSLIAIKRRYFFSTVLKKKLKSYLNTSFKSSSHVKIMMMN